MEKLIEITVGSLLDDMAKRYPDHDCALYTDRPFRKTYSEFNQLCNKVAKSFLKMGIKKGDHIAIWATNVPEWLVTLFASAKIGAVLVTVNTNYKVFELEYLLKQSDTNTLVLLDGFKDSNYIQIINELCPELKNSEAGNFHSEKLPYLKNVISVSAEKHPGMFNWDDIIEFGRDISDEELYNISNSLDCHDVINMQYTSGTTGFPKGVMLTHYNIINNGMCIGDCMHFTYADKLCIPVPFFHCFGLVLAIMACVTHGTTMVPIDYYSPIKVMNAIQSEGCTAVHGVPTMYIAMLEHPDFGKFDFSSLRTGIMSGSPCPIKVMEAVVEKMNMKDITIPYGQTEASPVCTQTRIGDSLELRVSTVGRSLPFIECKIVDPETNQDLPDGVPGEFVARGYNVMKGYYKMPEATAQAIDADGWLHTGDLATRDENGYYKITGRIKDMIIRGGENIYPKEIEEFLYTLPEIKDVQVIGVPSKVYGEEIMACVILKEGCSLTEEQVKAAVKANMARHKTPKFVGFLDSFPMTASGKIQKYKMRENAIAQLGLEDEAAIETA
ncbi:AMP-dependent synthetase and ligase [Ruminiclostridium papyrosolvens DSM 2782]|uniref:AMP-dependent synthetase and ligase n=1 Tax=Ruminiclostridium papyrosolvens DSM 2782 TaxID=588581 RepID=F1TAU1_9FIRM|nr:AMP-binding protein [Ruminiclostridium papyrosolvens]EGD48634.1 AMP-dependent synthetase and ligase [Ruminiclostridium papyrosolvens DSM 2782]WES32609.1 AMP-binding protein [Ruminiclostridium papyrosolvens DSM 2782]